MTSISRLFVRGRDQGCRIFLIPRPTHPEMSDYQDTHNASIKVMGQFPNHSVTKATIFEDGLWVNDSNSQLLHF